MFVTRIMSASTLFLIMAGILFVRPALAEPVSLPHDGLTLQGELRLAPGKVLKDGVILIIHGTLAHGRMDFMQAMQSALAERGLSSLAPTLAMGVDRRQGMYDCAVPHRHSNETIRGEIAGWVDWAAKAGASQIGLLGHSRGGAQVAWYASQASAKMPPALRKIILVAPTTFDPAIAAQEYRARYGADLQAVLTRAEMLVAGGQGAAIMQPVDFMYCPGAAVSARSFVDYHSPGRGNDAPEQLGLIPRPVLMVLAGAEDVVRDLPEKLANTAKPRGYQAIVIEGADHFFKDLYTDDVADAVAKFWAE